jgi:DNA-binding transcriptional ArsR family regulator
MLLFPKEEHDRIRDGEITVTFRDWDKIRVEAGKEYKSFDLGFVRVEEVAFIDPKKITEADLVAAGFDAMDEFKTIFRKRNPGFNFGSGKIIRIRFTYLGAEQRSAARVKPNDRELIRILERLVEIDVLSDLQIKSDAFLEFLDGDIPKNTVAISGHFSIPREAVRTRMAQLKNEGLVDARREGYTITVRGKAYLDSKI